MKNRLSHFFLILFSINFSQFAFAEERYSERLRQEILKKDQESEASKNRVNHKGYSEELRAKVLSEQSEEDKKKSDSYHYSEKLKGELGAKESSEGYSEKIQNEATAGDPLRMDSAIGALQEGRSELKMKRPGRIKNAAGFRVGARVNKKVSLEGSTILFSSIYKDSWSPDVSLFYEFHPFHWDSVFSLGFGIQFGYIHFSGKGQFQFPPSKPDGSRFDAATGESFTLQVYHGSIGPTLRLNALNYLRPFVRVYPGYYIYEEKRTFDKRSNKGKSLVLNMNAGVAVLLDWLSRDSTWNMYDNYSIKHYYITLDYLRLSTLSGKVRFSENSFFGGFTFEF